MFVEQPNGLRAHQLPGDARGRRMESEVAELGNAVPIAIIAEVAPGRAIVDAHIGAGCSYVALDASLQPLNPASEDTAQNHGPILPEGRHRRVVDQFAIAAHRRFPPAARCFA
jgi:hypothetical protein